MSGIEKIQKMVLERGTDLPNTVFICKKGDLLLLSYRPEVQYNNSWTSLELICRGLIINQVTGEIVARPFDKFFNWNENGRNTDSKIARVSEKLDGSLGIHYRIDKKVFVATRGSFDSQQALWATEHLNTKYAIRNFPNDWTLLFEIIYPENRIVVDYGGWSGLVLLAIRNRHTGNYIPHGIVNSVAKKFDFVLPIQYKFSNVQEVIKEARILPANDEGWVVKFEDGQLFKFKGEEYIELHKLVTGMTFKLVLSHHMEGTIGRIKEKLPDEFHKDLYNWVNTIDNTIVDISGQIEEAYKNAPKIARKGYAKWIQKNVPHLSKYMFARLDGKDLLPLIYKLAFK